MAQIEVLGGSVAAIEAGFIQNEIEEAAYRFQREIELGERIVVGVNKFKSVVSSSIPIQQIDAGMDSSRRAQVKAYREARDQGAATAALEVVRQAARGSDNLMPLVMQAFKAGATLGEVCGQLRLEWGEYRP